MIIKQKPEDFLVDEILLADMLSDRDTSWLLYKLKKTNYTTERAVQHIAKALRIPRKAIAYAGTKDKQAVTTQYITIHNCPKTRVDALELQDLELEHIGFATEALGLGFLEGNTFEILVRGVKLPEFSSEFMVPNYFDDQRFSSHNVVIGRALLAKDFKKACEILIEFDRDAGEKVDVFLKEHKNEYVGALQTLPKKNLLFYVHSVQSKLFNDLLSKELIEGSVAVDYSQGKLLFPEKALLEGQGELPLIGYDTNGYDDVLAEFGIGSRDFIIKQLPYLTLDGTTRTKFFKVKNCELVQKGDDVVATFDLPKGCYATIVLRQLFLEPINTKVQ